MEHQKMLSPLTLPWYWVKSVLKRRDQEIYSLQCEIPARLVVLTLTFKGLDAQATPQTHSIKTAEHRTQATTLKNSQDDSSVHPGWELLVNTEISFPQQIALPFTLYPSPPGAWPPPPPLLIWVQTLPSQGSLSESLHSVMFNSDTISCLFFKVLICSWLYILWDSLISPQECKLHECRVGACFHSLGLDTQ